VSTRGYRSEPRNGPSHGEVFDALRNPIAGKSFVDGAIPRVKVDVGTGIPYADLDIQAGDIPYSALTIPAGAIPNTKIDRVAWGELGYAQVTAAQTGITVETDLTNLTTTVTVGASRKVKITGYGIFTRTVADGVTQLRIKEAGTTIQIANIRNAAVSGQTAAAVIRRTPSAGSITYKLTLSMPTGTGTAGLSADPLFPAFILVEDIGPV
jgi:hypothetical protein